MKIKSLELDGIGGIGNLVIHFNDHFNLICGQNGVGKTTILECIGHGFSQTSSHWIKRNVKYAEGKYKISVDFDGTIQERSVSTKSFHPWDKQDLIRGFREYAKEIIVFKTTRSFQYLDLNSLSKDKEKQEGNYFSEASLGVDYSDIKNWFVQRFMWSKHEGLLSDEQISNLELAKSVFSLLSPDVSFSKVVPDSFDILIKNSFGEIYYEYLSSGYKSCLIMMLGLIKEIEIRNKNPRIKVNDFKGVVLIDEIDLHLHPDWQSRFLSVIKKVFPNTQFIVTTHSPHIIQAAEPSEIIPLELKDNEVVLREIPSMEFGFKGWTIEEILTDVMGMKSTKSEIFESLLNQFFVKIYDESEEEAKQLWESLDKILHPKSEWRKLLKIHLASIGVEV